MSFNSLFFGDFIPTNRIGFAILLVFFTFVAKSSHLEIKSQEAIHLLYEFRFKDADSIIANLENQYPDHYLPAMIRASFFWWQMISQAENLKLQDKYRNNLILGESLMPESVNSDHPENSDLFYSINVYAFRARLDLMNGDYLRAIRHLNRSIGFIGNSLGKEIVFEPFLLTSGLYNYMAGYGRKKYPFMAIYTLRHPKGDIDLGLLQLQKAANGNEMLINTEANYFLMKIYLELEEDLFWARYYADRLVVEYPDNLVFLYYYYIITKESNLPSEAAKARTSYFESLKNNSQLSPLQKDHFKNLI